MKILLLPFHFRVFFAKNTRVSGIDECLIKQYKVLSKNNTVKIFLSYSDIENPDFIVFSRERENTEGLFKKDKSKLMELLTKTVKNFKPDVILSNYGFNKNLYSLLNSFKIPIFYLNHCLPGQPADVFGANDLSEFLNRGHSLGCVSEFHWGKLTEYYSKPRSTWVIQPNVKVESIVPSSYSEYKPVIASIPKTVKHISSCNEYKGTFIAHDMSLGTDLHSEIFTTVKHIGGNTEQEYLAKNLKKFTNIPNLLTNFDIPHQKIMEKIRNSAAFFVGKSQGDTFGITSIEALQCGIPLIIFGEKEVHPANDFVEPEFKKYIRYVKNRTQFYDTMMNFSSISLEDRKSLAESCVRKMGENNFSRSYTEALEKTIRKYKNSNFACQSLDSFFD